MATWVTHLIIADRVLEKVSWLCKHEFCVGNIAPDCNVENENWTQFTPSREVTHWMTNERKVASDCDRFYNEYIEKRKEDINSDQEESFLLGYYAHLITDAEFQRYIRDEYRVEEAWKRIENHVVLGEKSKGMLRNWDSVKLLISGKERMKDIYSIEKEYLDEHPNSGYLTEIIGLKSFPNYMDFLPDGAIVRKIEIIGYIPKNEMGDFPFVGMSRNEYNIFIEQATEMVIDALSSKV